MADSDTENSLVSSSGTLEALTVEQILQVLRDAAQDAADTKDYLSYLTVLDIHLSDPARFSLDERDLLLQQLLDSLDSDHELVAEVGWDIPALVVPFVDSDFAFTGGIRDAPCVYKVLKIFEVLALHGNAKELYLKSTELLSTLKQDRAAENLFFAEKFYEIKLYCIFELVTSSMRRVHTLYPLRFLAMAVSSVVNHLCLNPVQNLSCFNFVMKRIYGFARNYVSPPTPDTTAVLPEDLARIQHDEDHLLRKLLTALVTESTFMAMRLEWLGFTVSYFNHLHRAYAADKPATLDYVLDVPVMARLKELALSFDLAPHRDFERFVALSEKLVDFHAATAAAGDDAAYSSELFERLVVDYQALFSNCIVNHKTGSVADSVGGLLLLHTYEISSNNGAGAAALSLQQAIAMAIRVIVPGIVHRSLQNRGLLDMAVFWCWYAVLAILASPAQLALDLSAVPVHIMRTFLQALLYAICSTSPDSRFRYLTLTLLTKVLSAAPEDAAYAFIMGALRECPFRGAKPVLVGVLRVLVVSEKKADELSEGMQALRLSKDSDKTAGAPPLPARQPTEKANFISLTDSRADDILSLVEQYVGLTFGEADGATQVNFEHLSTLQGLLNLLVPLRKSALIAPARLEEIAASTEAHVALVETGFKGEGKNRVALNAVVVLRVALARLGA